MELVKRFEEIFRFATFKPSGTSKTIWNALYRVLMELQTDGKIEKLESKAGFFWRKR